MNKPVASIFISICLLLSQAAGAVFASEKDFQKAVSLYKQEKYKPAVTNLNKAIKDNQVDYRAYFFKGRCMQKLGDRKGARDSYMRAVQFGYKTKVGNEAAKVLFKMDRNAYLQAIGMGKRFSESIERNRAAAQRTGSGNAKSKADSKKPAKSK